MSRPPFHSLATRPVRRILLMMGWYNIGIHRGIARYAKEVGWALDAMTSHQADIGPVWQPDGVICILGVNRRMDNLVEDLRLPTVNIGYHTTLPIPRVSANDRLIAGMAAEHFAQRGFRHIAFYYKGLFNPGESERSKQLRQAADEHGCRFHLIDASKTRGGKTNPAAMFNVLRGALVGLPKPLAILGWVDETAIEIVTACRMEKLRVPEQVAVLGVGNDELRCEFAPVPLSSVDDNPEAIGHTAAALLDRKMAGRHVSLKPVLIPPIGVVTRQSSDILAIGHVEVATVLKNIWSHFREPISARDVANGVPLSYRRLHDVFVKYVGHSIFDEILRRRLEYASKLLAETDQKIEVVGREAGFSDGNHFGKAFLRKHRRTPSEFRELVRGRG